VPAVTDDRPTIEHFLFEWDGPFDVRELLAVRPAGGSPAWQAEALRVQAAALMRGGEYDQALALSLQADLFLPDNRYGQFLRELEYGCLVPLRAQ
jgi:hypothetical protein